MATRREVDGEEADWEAGEGVGFSEASMDLCPCLFQTRSSGQISAEVLGHVAANMLDGATCGWHEEGGNLRR